MAVGDVEAAILEHSRFFDHLVELIPARFYVEEEAVAKLRFVPKADRAEEAERRRVNAKAAKLARLDPDQPQTALQIQQQQSRDAAARKRRELTPSATGRHTEAGAGAPQKRGPDTKSPGGMARMDELRGKLQKRLQALRQQRKADEKKQQVDTAKQFRDKQRKVVQQPPAKTQQKRKLERDEPASNARDPENLNFGMLDFGEGTRPAKKQKKLSKAELLQQAERQAAENAEMAGTATGQAQLQKAAWSSALAKAKGEKVYNDPKLLRKSLKRDEKRQKKSAAAWKERESHQQQEGKDRQQKRRENLQARARAKQQKKIAKREKKLMRPGFEGRRDTFINS